MESRAGRQCPSFLQIALWEAGDLHDLPGAFIHSHAGLCTRCGGTVFEIRAARSELFGVVAADHEPAARAVTPMIAPARVAPVRR